MQPAMTPARVMVNTMAVLFVLAMAWLLLKIYSILILLLIGILFAAAVEPLVFRLRKRGLSRGQSIMIVYVAIAAVLGLALYLVLPPLVSQGTGLVNEIPTFLADFRVQALESDSRFLRTTGVRLIERAQSTYQDLQERPPIGSSTAYGLATSVVGALFSIVSVLIVAFYWMTEKALIKRALLGLVPLDKRDRAHSLWDEIEAKLGGWTRGQLSLCLIIGALSAIAYFALGLDFWFALAIWAGITEIVPFIGPFLGGAVATVVALTDSWQKALIVVAFVIVLQQLEGAVLVPRVMRNAVGMTPLTVILAVFIGGAVLGPLGAVLAIPIGAAVQVFVQDLLRAREADPDTGATGDAVAATLAGEAVPAIDGPAPPAPAGAAATSVAERAGRR